MASRIRYEKQRQSASSVVISLRRNQNDGSPMILGGNALTIFHCEILR